MKFLLLSVATVALAAPTLKTRDSIISSSDFNELHRAAQLSSAAYSGCQGSAFGVTITHQLSNGATDTQGYIGHDDTNKRISVVLRGSTDPHDILNDIDIVPVTPSLSGVNFPSWTQLMKGVFDPWNSVHSEVIAAVSALVQQYPSYTLEVTGHSLGGSLTYLGHVALAQNFPGHTVTSNALAAFPIGNSVWAGFAGSQGTLRRGNNAGDGVPNMWLQFSHYGTEYYGPGIQGLTLKCSGERDLLCSAGDGWFTVDLQHISNSGVVMLLAGCGN
jgi:Lipase (class 3)